MKRALMLGCGTSRERKIRVTAEDPVGFDDYELITIDFNKDCKPTIVHDMNFGLPKKIRDQWNSFDEIHAYDSLEHWGQQGDFRDWFNEMENYHNILRPGGRFFTLVPTGEERFVDPGHVRFFGTNYFWVLSQKWYREMNEKGIHVGDYRWYWKKDFNVLTMQYLTHPNNPNHHLAVVLEKVE